MWRKLQKLVANMEKMGLGWWGNSFSEDFVSHVSVSVFYLLSSVYSSFKGTVTSSESTDDSSIVFNEL